MKGCFEYLIVDPEIWVLKDLVGVDRWHTLGKMLSSPLEIKLRRSKVRNDVYRRKVRDYVCQFDGYFV